MIVFPLASSDSNDIRSGIEWNSVKIELQENNIR